MRFLSVYVSMDFANTLSVVKEALKRQKLSIVAEIDMRQVLKKDLSVDLRPYVVLSTCSLPMTHRAIKADDAIGSVLLCHFVIQENCIGRVQISTADPACTIGTINHVEMISISQELRSLLQKVMRDIEVAPKLDRAA
jgi:uncharacterized protein (DUF302 family)